MSNASSWRSSSRRQFLKDTAVGGAGLVVAGALTPVRGASSSRPAGTEPEQNSEWTFERAEKIWKPMTRAVAHVGVPGYQWQAGVLWDGSLAFGPLGWRDHLALVEEALPLGNNLLHVSVGYGDRMRLVDRGGAGNTAIRRRLENGRLPIPHVETQDGDLIWEETVFAHLPGRSLAEGMQPRADDVLAVDVLFRVRSTTTSPTEGHLWLHFGNTSQVSYGLDKTGQGDELGQELPHRFEPPFGMLSAFFLGVPEDQVRYVIPQPAKGEVIWHEEVAAPAGMKNAARRVIEWAVPLAAGEEAELQLIIPYGLVDLNAAKNLAPKR